MCEPHQARKYVGSEPNQELIEMAKKDEYTIKCRKVGNSIAIILPKRDYIFRDLEPGDWIKVEFKGIVR